MVREEEEEEETTVRKPRKQSARYQVTRANQIKSNKSSALPNLLKTLPIHSHGCNSSIVPKGWCLDSGGIPRFVGRADPSPPSFVRHYSHEGYERCLANKTVVFVGDSRVRYQFLHLASFLASKKHMKCQDFNFNNKSIEVDEECYLIDRKNHVKMAQFDWNSWYNQTTNMLGNGQESLCECYRPDPLPKTELAHENRFIKRPTRYGDATLVYLQNFENLVQIDSNFPPFLSFSNSSHRCKPGECSPNNRDNAFRGNLNKTIWNILPRLNTTHAFVNLGWEHVFGLRKESDFSCVIQEFERHHLDIKVNLISHVPAYGYKTPKSNFSYSEIMKCKVNVFDRFQAAENVPKSWYFNRLHVLAILNKEYNHQLLEKICPLEN